MKRPFWILPVLLGPLTVPFSARADAGTQLMIAGTLHLVFGNAVIGVFEGLLIAWIFRLPKLKTAMIIIPANYFSAWVGMVFVESRIVQSLHLDLNNGWHWLWIMVVVTYFMTLILEWPFVAWCFRRQEHWLRKSMRANVLAQTASYVVLCGWYWMASDTSLYTKMHVVRSKELALPDNVVVYFISEKDGGVYKRTLLNPAEVKVGELHSKSGYDGLCARPSSEKDGRWDLVANVIRDGEYVGQPVEILTNLFVDTPMTRALDVALGGASNSSWQVVNAVWSIDLRAVNKTTGEKLAMGYETPFGNWSIRNAV